jgi:hypothetical protein
MEEFCLHQGGWSSYMPGMPEVLLIAKTRVFKDCADASQLTEAEIEGRRQIRSILDIMRTYGRATPELLSLSSRIGIRETCRIRCLYQLTEDDVLYGRRFDDGIANMAYPVDIHHGDEGSVTQRFLDGYEERIVNGERQIGRWRNETDTYSTFYQIPLRSLLPRGDYDNLIVCGRSIDADDGAFASSRVMISANQQGEAAGVAAALASRDESGVREVDSQSVRKTLADGGSIIL